MEGNLPSNFALFIAGNSFSLRRIVSTIADAGFTVSQCQNLPQGFSLLHAKPWDIIFIEKDVLPRDYEDVCFRLHGGSAAALVLLGRDREESASVQEALILGMDCYIRMSTGAPELVARSRSLLRRKNRRNGHSPETLQ